MKRMLFAVLSVAAFATLGIAGPAVTLTGCSEADELIDCTKICNKYSDCFDSEYDVDACVDRCERLEDAVEIGVAPRLVLHRGDRAS